jgi:Protein of unknown function (DUF4239)
MLVDLIYGVPTWEMAAVVVAVSVGASLVGLVVATRLLPAHIRHKHNELAGFNSALVGVVFAVLLAFLAVATWESFGKAGDTAATEAALTGDLARDAVVMPEPLRSELIDDIRDYVTIVLNKEWPAMAKGAAFGDDGWAPLRKFHQDLVSLKTSDPVQVAIFQETLGRLNSLYDARRSRILAAHDHIEPAVWWVVLLGAVITISFTFLFGMENFTIHLWMTTAVATSLALVIVLIVAFDYPFRGEVQIGPGGFENVRHNMEVNGIKFASDAR